jgi:hypothetical protein
MSGAARHSAVLCGSRSGNLPIGAGLALLPAAALVLVLSRPGTTSSAGWSILLAGFLVCVAALLLAVRVDAGAGYLTGVLLEVAFVGIARTVGLVAVAALPVPAVEQGTQDCADAGGSRREVRFDGSVRQRRRGQ